jgi:hypothetical protein
LRRGDLGAPQNHRQPDDIATLAEEVRVEGVAETVPAKAREAITECGGGTEARHFVVRDGSILELQLTPA